jgi:hypothetical protein
MLTSDYRKLHPLHPHDVPEKTSNEGKRKGLVELQDVFFLILVPHWKDVLQHMMLLPIKSR